MRKLALLATALGATALVFVGASVARSGDDNGKKFALTGYQETPSISTAARGQLRLRVNDTQLRYRLAYEGLEGGGTPVAHLHLGERHTAGGIIAWLCGGGGKPACPAASGTVEGTIAAADVLGPAAQGIAPGQFNEVVRALRAGAVYANVHTATYAGGEIRGQVRVKGGKGSDDD